MMTSMTMYEYATAEPFEPFRLNMASGKAFTIRHPEMVKVGKTSIIVYSVDPAAPETGTRWQDISLMLIESVEPLESSTKKDGNAL